MNKKEILFKLLIFTQLFNETLDDLKATAVFKHSLKRKGKHFEDELKLHLNPYFNQMFEVDEEMIQKMLASLDKVVNSIKDMDLIKINYLEDVLDKANELVVNFETQKIEKKDGKETTNK